MYNSTDCEQSKIFDLIHNAYAWIIFNEMMWIFFYTSIKM